MSSVQNPLSSVKYPLSSVGSYTDVDSTVLKDVPQEVSQAGIGAALLHGHSWCAVFLRRPGEQYTRRLGDLELFGL